MKKGLALMVAAFMAASGMLQAQTVIGNFEGGSFDGWTPEETGAMSVFSSDTFGATLGTGSLKIQTPGDWHKVAKYNAMSLVPQISQPGTATTVSLDLTMRNDDGSIPGWWQKSDLILNSDGTGWFPLGEREPGVPWSPTTYTLTWTIPAAQCAAVANSQWYVEFFLINNCGAGGASIFVDNIRVDTVIVPEPGTAALLGLGLAGLLVIRRRAA